MRNPNGELSRPCHLACRHLVVLVVLSPRVAEAICSCGGSMSHDGSRQGSITHFVRGRRGAGKNGAYLEWLRRADTWEEMARSENARC